MNLDNHNRHDFQDGLNSWGGVPARAIRYRSCLGAAQVIVAPYLWQSARRGRLAARSGWWLAGLIVLVLLAAALAWGLLLPGNGWLPARAPGTGSATQTHLPNPQDETSQDSLPLPLPQPVFNALEGIQSDYIFDDNFTDSYFHAVNATIAAGVVALTGSEGGQASWSDDHPYARGQAALLLFTFTPDASFTLGLTQNEGGAFWGLDQLTSLFLDTGSGPRTQYALMGSLKLEPGSWYYGLFTPAPQGGMACFLWARDDPSRSAYSYDTSAFSPDGWRFGLQVQRGSVWIDRYFGLLYDSLGAQFGPQNSSEGPPSG